MVICGAIFASAFQSNDLTNTLIHVLDFGIFAAVIIIIATWTTNDNNLYQSVLGLTNAFHGKIHLPRWAITAVCGLIATALGAIGVIEWLLPFLNILSVVVPHFIILGLVNQAETPVYQCFQTILGTSSCTGIFAEVTCIPRMRYEYCSGVISASSAVVRGHWNRPVSNRLYSSRNPSPSQMTPFNRSGLRPQNWNLYFQFTKTKADGGSFSSALGNRFR